MKTWVKRNFALSNFIALYNKLDRGASRPKKRGRPRKVDVDCGRSGTPIIQGTQPVTPMEAFKVFVYNILFEVKNIGSKEKIFFLLWLIMSLCI